ncbi:MAG: MBL fold metallo-hydrolase [Imperialibacter sp.]|uniref:MBL fold metallo-hydrolase n=1 Tax=Imperialibacter sp. TaxID=2038411 RepID=UPI0032EE18B6
MNRKDFLRSSLLIGGLLATSSPHAFANKRRTTVRLLRHATLWVEMGGVKLLVDPMLSAKDTMPPVQNAGNDLRIPMVDLPLSSDEVKSLVSQCDAVLVTHIHRDHWDSEAHALIPKNKSIFCQPFDLEKIRELGFENAVAIASDYPFQGLSITRTGGQHGTGEIGQLMGMVSGFVIKAGADKLYIAGDTIWCDEVETALAKYTPNVIVVNAGAAQFLKGDPITMSLADIEKVLQSSGKAKVIAVHMDTVNHCHLHKTDVTKYAAENNHAKRLLVPADGEVISI